MPASAPNSIKLRTRRNCVVSSIRSTVSLHQSEEYLFETSPRAHGSDAHARHDQRLIKLGHCAPRRGDHELFAARIDRFHAVHHAQCVFGSVGVVHLELV